MSTLHIIGTIAVSLSGCCTAVVIYAAWKSRQEWRALHDLTADTSILLIAKRRPGIWACDIISESGGLLLPWRVHARAASLERRGLLVSEGSLTGERCYHITEAGRVWLARGAQ